MTENKNPEQSSDELLDLISRYSDANRIKKGDETAEDKLETVQDDDVKLFEEAKKSAEEISATEAVNIQPTRVSNKELSGIDDAVAVIKSEQPHYTNQAEENTVMSSPEGGHFTDAEGKKVEHNETSEELFGEDHFSAGDKNKNRKKKRQRAYRRAKRRNREKRAHGSLTISIIKALAYTLAVMILAFFVAFGFPDIWPGIIPMANDIFAFVKADDEKQVVLSENMTTAEVAALLKENGIIDEEKVFTFYVKYKYVDDNAVEGEEEDIVGTIIDIFGDFSKTMFLNEEVPPEEDIKYLAGTYTLNPDMNYDQIIKALTTEPYVREEVTIVIPEGYTVEQIISLLVENGIGRRENYIYAINEYPYKHEFVKLLEEEGYPEGRIYRLEGYLYPDTYIFYKDYDEVDVINKMLNTFSARVWSEYYSTYKPVCESMGFTFDEMVTFASIVQAEGKSFSDFENISQVFHNRFNSADFDKMESDATIQYVMEIERLRMIREEGVYEDRVDILNGSHLEIDTPYNSYMYSGLPAGAICNPGLDAFDAAVYPDMAAEVKAEFNLTTAYFFNADLAGNIYYAQTPYQHSVNKQKAAEINEQIKNGTYVGNN
ncbi:MAG: endolytic transglycosylase MltG [Ruminococcaceae bacterium]|nr:endolytic transglycosylase MltG [Oscillospiraceae bacterium]